MFTDGKRLGSGDGSGESVGFGSGEGEGFGTGSCYSEGYGNGCGNGYGEPQAMEMYLEKAMAALLTKVYESLELSQRTTSAVPHEPHTTKVVKKHG